MGTRTFVLCQACSWRVIRLVCSDSYRSRRVLSSTMTIIVTPGIDFIAPYLVKLSVPPIFLVLAAKYLATNHHLSIPTWVLVSASILSVPFISATKIIRKSVSDRRTAASLGARLVPVFEGKWIGNLDILSFLLRGFDTGYPGMCILSCY